MGRPVPPTALVQVPLKPLPQVLGKSVSRPPTPGVPTCVHGYGHMPPLLSGSSGGCPAVWSISHQRGYCSREFMVRPPHPGGSSCGAPLLCKRTPPGLCTGSPVTGCFHGSG